MSRSITPRSCLASITPIIRTDSVATVGLAASSFGAQDRCVLPAAHHLPLILPSFFSTAKSELSIASLILHQLKSPIFLGRKLIDDLTALIHRMQRLLLYLRFFSTCLMLQFFVKLTFSFFALVVLMHACSLILAKIVVCDAL